MLESEDFPDIRPDFYELNQKALRLALLAEAASFYAQLPEANYDLISRLSFPRLDVDDENE